MNIAFYSYSVCSIFLMIFMFFFVFYIMLFDFEKGKILDAFETTSKASMFFSFGGLLILSAGVVLRTPKPSHIEATSTEWQSKQRTNQQNKPTNETDQTNKQKKKNKEPTNQTRKAKQICKTALRDPQHL